MVQPGVDFVGRDTELALFNGVLADLVAGTGRAVLVEGEAGIGKSALLEVGLAGAEAAGCLVLRGACDELTQRFPLSVVLQMLGVEEGAGDERRAAVARSLAGPVDGSALGTRLAAGDPVMAAVEQLVGLVDRLCAEGPVVLVLEDLHWADEAALVLWWRLIRASGQLPLLLVASCRPWPLPRELGQLRAELREPVGVVVSLRGLSEAEVGRVVQDRLGSAPGGRLGAALESAGGNPFYVRELVDALVRSGSLHEEAGCVDLVRAGDWSRAVLSLTEAVGDRLSALSAGAGEALRTASLLGPTFSVGDLGVVLGQAPMAVVELVREAMEAGVLEAAGGRLRFRHGLLRETLYQEMAPSLRAALHRQVFEAFVASGAGPVRVAESLLPVLGAADGWELGWITEHAGDLVDRAPQVAAELLEHALDRLPAGDPQRAAAAATLLPICVYLRRYESADELAREILSDDDLDPEQEGQAWWFLVRNHFNAGRIAAAVEAVSAAQASHRLTPVWGARLAVSRAVGLGVARRIEEARRQAQAALELGEELHDALAEGYALHALSWLATVTDDLELGARYNDQAANRLRGNDPKLTDLAMLVGDNRCAFLQDQDEFDRAEQDGQQLLAAAERVWTLRLSDIRVRLAEIAYARGRWDDAQAQLELAAETPASTQVGVTRHGFLAVLAARHNEWEQASSHLNAINELDPDDSLALTAPTVLVGRVLLAERSQAPERILEALAPCLTSDDGLHSADQHMLLPDLVRATTAVGDEATLRAVRAFYDKPTPGPRPPRHLAGTWWVQGLLTGDPTPVLRSADYFRRVGRLPWLGGALEDAAVLQAARGDAESARSTIAQALEVYAALGAVWDARRAGARIRAHGIRQGVRTPRRRPRTGWAALSDTEARIAAMVAQGLSNPDIAQELVLSRRTVETHVSHILAKLQIRSRRQVTRPVDPALVNSS